MVIELATVLLGGVLSTVFTSISVELLLLVRGHPVVFAGCCCVVAIFVCVCVLREYISVLYTRVSSRIGLAHLTAAGIICTLHNRRNNLRVRGSCSLELGIQRQTGLQVEAFNWRPTQIVCKKAENKYANVYTDEL